MCLLNRCVAFVGVPQTKLCHRLQQHLAHHTPCLHPPSPHAGNSINERAGNGRGGGGNNGGSSGPNSWQFYAPVRQLLADKPAAAAATPEAAPKQPTTPPTKKPTAAPKQTATPPAKKSTDAPKQAAKKPTQAPQATKKIEAAPKQQQGQQQAPAQAPKVQPERGFRGMAGGGMADFAGMPGGGQAYPLMNVRNVSDAS
jgi:outer membrane biosynthesis protein TonB